MNDLSTVGLRLCVMSSDVSLQLTTALYQQKANLARIRDNQRRSRARRKEYLQDLEAKYRTCEAVGVEASAEIQGAARRVLDENKRLRLMLRQAGFSDDQIDSASLGEVTNGIGMRSQNMGRVITAAEELGTLLEERKKCGSGDGDDSRDGSEVGEDDLAMSSRRWSLGPAIASQNEAPGGVPTTGSSAAQNGEMDVKPPMYTAHSTSTSTPIAANTVSSFGLQTNLDQQHFSIQNQQQQDYNPIQPLALDSYTQWHAPAAHADAADVSPTYSQTAYTASDPGTMAAIPHPDLNQDPYAFQQQVPYYDNASSCQTATAIIQTLNPKAQSEDLERALGCGKGQECLVDNAVVFEVMDRFAG